MALASVRANAMAIRKTYGTNESEQRNEKNTEAVWRKIETLYRTLSVPEREENLDCLFTS